MKLNEICTTVSRCLLLNKLETNNGEYPLYGAKGIMKYINFYDYEQPYVGVIKWGAGVGRVGIYPAKSSILGTIQGLMPNSGIDVKWFYYYLKSLHLESFATKTSVPNIYFRDYGKCEVHVPSQDYQIEVAKILSKIEELKSNYENQIALFDEIVRSRFIEMFGDINNNPDTVDLESLCVKITDGSHNPPKGIRLSNNLMISSQNIHDNIIDYEDARLLSDDDFAIEDKRTNIRPGDVLLTIVGAIGRSAVVVDKNKITCQRSVCVIRPNEKKMNSVFLKYMLDNIGSQIEDEARGVAQKGIYLNQVKKLKVIKPSLNEQNAFASFVAEIKKSKDVLQKQIETASELLDSKMQEYFSEGR